MILVRVELHSAQTGRVTELGRMKLCNQGGRFDDTRGNYSVEVMRRGTLDVVQRRGEVRDYPRKSYSIWRLVMLALQSAFDKGGGMMPGAQQTCESDLARRFSQLVCDYFDATECNLATLSELMRLKSTSLRRIERQTRICLSMLTVCRQHEDKIDWGVKQRPEFPRVRDILLQAKHEPEGLAVALTRWKGK